jgi:hypothetical protein
MQTNMNIFLSENRKLISVPHHCLLIAEYKVVDVDMYIFFT